MRGCRAIVANPMRPTPFSFPLMVEMFREKLTTEALETRVARMVADQEAAAQKG
jgi:ATP-dependent Lhr-like helicase